MNSAQVAIAEKLLDLKVPQEYREFLDQLPSDAEQIEWSKPVAIIIWNDPELLAVMNLDLRQSDELYDGDTWPRHYLAIGDDGFGNVYCVDTENLDSAPMIFYDHEDAEGFVQVEPSNPELYQTLLENLANTRSESVAEEVGDLISEPCLSISRANAPWKSRLYPISLTEWKALAEADPSLRYRGYREAMYPVTGETIQLPSEGYVLWESGTGGSIPIRFESGRLILEAVSDSAYEKTKEISTKLGARVFDQEGREIVL